MTDDYGAGDRGRVLAAGIVARSDDDIRQSSIAAQPLTDEQSRVFVQQIVTNVSAVLPPALLPLLIEGFKQELQKHNQS